MTNTSDPLALVSQATWTAAMYSPFFSNLVLSDRGFVIRGLPSGRPGPPAPDEVAPELVPTADFILLNFSKNLDDARKHHDLCLALGRGPKNTLLIAQSRRPIEIETPYPTIYFRNAVHLMSEMRQFLGISEALDFTEHGYSMVFRAPSPFFAFSDLLLPQALLTTLRDLRFSGRCQCYSNERRVFDQPDYILALGIRELTANLHLEFKWWKRLEETLCAALGAQNAGVTLVPMLTEFVELETMSLVNFPDGAADFEDGRPTRLCFPRQATSWFARLILAELQGQMSTLHRD